MTNMHSRVGQFINLFSPHLHGGRRLGAGVRTAMNEWFAQNLGGQRFAEDGSLLVHERGLPLRNDGGAELRKKRRLAKKTRDIAAGLYAKALVRGDGSHRALWKGVLACDAAVRRLGRDDDPAPQRSVATPLTTAPEASGRALDKFLKSRMTAADWDTYQSLLKAPASSAHGGLARGSALERGDEPAGPRHPAEIGAMPNAPGDPERERRLTLDSLKRIEADPELGGGLNNFGESDRRRIIAAGGLPRPTRDPVEVGRRAALAHDEAERDRDFEKRWPDAARIGVR